MPDLSHRYMCAYYSQNAHNNIAPREQAYWDAYKFVTAVKSQSLNGWLTVPTKPPEKINEKNVGRTRELFGDFIVRAIALAGWPKAVIVPIPSKDGLLGATSFRSLRMVEDSLRRHSEFPIVPALRFLTELKPAHQGGPRGRKAMSEAMALIGAIPPGPVVIVDDLLTSGGTALAAYDLLARDRRSPVLVVTCGYTVEDTAIAAWGDHERKIDTSPKTISFTSILSSPAAAPHR